MIPPNQKSAISFAQEFFWEFVQNIVLITGFFVALAVWQQQARGVALGIIVIGGVLGAWNIRWIEAKFKDHSESLRVTAANSLMMPVLMLVFVAYLAVDWSHWGTDVLIGAFGGFALSVVQRLAIRAKLDVARSLAFAIAFPVTLLSIRGMLLVFPLLLTILMSTAIVTFLIVFIHQRSKK